MLYGEGQQLSAGSPWIVWVVYFNSLQALGSKPGQPPLQIQPFPQLSPPAVHERVGQDRNTARSSDQLDGFLRKQLVAFHVGRPVASDPQIKSFVVAAYMTSLQESGCDVRAPDRAAAPREVKYPFPFYGKAQVRETYEHLLGTFPARYTCASQQVLELTVVNVHKIAQEVNLFPSADGANLHPWHNGDVFALCFSLCCSNRFRGIVVCDPQHLDAQTCCSGY
jgi:hypothetical protein